MHTCIGRRALHAGDDIPDAVYERLGVLRILMVTPRFAPLVGGVETHTAEVATRLAALGHDVAVLTTDAGGTLPPQDLYRGVPVWRVNSWPPGRDYHFSPGIYRRIMVDRERWDIIHCQSYHTFVAPTAMLAARRAGIPYVVSFHSGGHSSRARNALRRPQVRLLRPLLAGAARLIAVSEFEAGHFQQLLRLPRACFVVAPNGSQLPVFTPPEETAGNNGRPIVVSIGRLERYKGHQRAITAMPFVLKQRPDVQLKIVGTGPYEDALRKLIVKHNLMSDVQITSVPGADREGMARLLSSASLVTLLSDYEAHPIAVMEAAALKRPVLVTQTSGLAELAARGLAHAIPLASTAEEIATAILAHLDREVVQVDLSWSTWEHCTAQLLAVYTDALRPHSCAS